MCDVSGGHMHIFGYMHICIYMDIFTYIWMYAHAHGWIYAPHAHMGQIPQDGKNEQYVALFFNF